MSEHPGEGWIKLTLLWIASFMDNLFSAQTLNTCVAIAVLVLTLLQIRVTWRKMREPHTPPQLRSRDGVTDYGEL